MEITGTSNKALAKHLIVDPSLISQLRTGVRNVTKKNSHVKNMSFYFAEKCQTQSRMLALYELIGDKNLNGDCGITQTSDIIYNFLINDNRDEWDSMLQYQAGIELFKSNPRIRKAELIPQEAPAGTFVLCHNDEEKKEHMKKLFEHFMAMKSPDVIYFSSEEIIDWIYNDPVYYNDFRSWCITLINRGFSFVRIMKPMENKEYFLKNILLWFPMYMTGHVHLYYYPHFRDDIYRQTIITIDRAASYFSSSIARTGNCYYSFFSNDQELSAAYVKQLKDYLTFCKSSIHVYKREKDITEAFSELVSLPGDRITKSYNLSPESIPYKAMINYMENSDSPEHRHGAEIIKHIYTAAEKNKVDSVIIDMCTLASADDVKNGKVRIQLPGLVNSAPVYYNAKLYAIHLRNVLSMLETNSNYHFFPIYPADFGEYSDDYAPISVVDNHTMLLVTPENVIHFTQPDIIHTLYEHLYREAKIRANRSHSRDEVMEEIRELLRQLED
jgi:hypothetical protein